MTFGAKDSKLNPWIELAKVTANIEATLPHSMAANNLFG
jgi:hypothetical protein